MVQPLVMVVHRHAENALCVHLPDHIIIQNLADIARRRHAIGGFQPRRLCFFPDDIHAQFNAFITDEYRRPGNQLAYFMLAFATERTVKRVLAVAAGIICHRHPLPPCPHSGFTGPFKTTFAEA
jgi:hypothetical protein